MCTNILLKSEDKAVTISARTMDFGSNFSTRLYKTPRNYNLFDSFSKEQSNFLNRILDAHPWEPNKYGYLAAKAYFEIDDSKVVIPTCMDGINEKGLSAASLWMPCTKYPTRDKCKKNIYSIFLNDYILGNFSTVKEIEKEFDDGDLNVINWEKLDKYIATHFIFSDITGASLVVEFERGSIKTYQPTNGVLTNHPFYHEHLKNLGSDKYAKLKFKNSEKTKCCNVSEGQDINGSGLLGLPGDATPKSRFIRASILSKVKLNDDSPQSSVTQVWQVLQALQVPKRTILPNNNKLKKDQFDADHTKWGVIRECRDNQAEPSKKEVNYYYYTSDNPTLNKISLNDLDWNSNAYKYIDFEPENKPNNWCVDKSDALNIL